MSCESGYVSVGKERMHYLKWGSGRRLLLAFHGFDNNAHIYDPLRPHLSAGYTVLSFDLPHHGKSEWNTASRLTAKDLQAMVEALMQEYKVDKVSLLGYSMGGRVCMNIITVLPAKVDKVALVATDGLIINNYYYFFTRTYIGQALFKRVMNKPDTYLKIADWLKKKKLVDASQHKFAMYYLQSARSREHLLKVWPAMSRLIPSPAKIKAAIKKYRVRVTIFMGVYDRVMPPALAEQFKTGLETVRVVVLQKGHKIFDHENANEIAECLL